MNGLKYILTFLLGAGAGVGGTYIVLNKKFNSKLESAISDLDEHFEEKCNKCEKKAVVEDKSKDVDERIQRKPSLDKGSVDLKVPITSMDNNEVKTQKVSYFKMVKDLYGAKNVEIEEEEVDDDIEPESAEDKLAKMLDANPYHDRPFFISQAAYDGDDDLHYREDYDHIELDYFEDDDTVCLRDKNHTIVEKENTLLADGWRDAFGNYDDYGYEDDEFIYCRNDKMRTDYKILRYEEGYSQVVLGIDPPGVPDKDD